MAVPDKPKRLDLKVAATSGGALLAGVVLAGLEALVAQPALLEGLPPVLRFLVIAAGPTLIVFLSGVAVPKEEPRPPGCECPEPHPHGHAPQPEYRPKRGVDPLENPPEGPPSP